MLSDIHNIAESITTDPDIFNEENIDEALHVPEFLKKLFKKKEEKSDSEYWYDLLRAAQDAGILEEFGDMLVRRLEEKYKQKRQIKDVD